MSHTACLSGSSFSTKLRATPGFRGSKHSWSNGESFQITEKEKEWRTALINGDLAHATRLLSTSPELVNWQDYITGNTALHFACKDNDIALIRLLAGTYKANVEVKNHGGLTPLHMAASTASDDAVSALLSNQANAASRDYSGRLPVFYLPQTSKNHQLRHHSSEHAANLLIAHPLFKYLMANPTANLPLCVEFTSPLDQHQSGMNGNEDPPKEKCKSNVSLTCGAFNLAYCTGRFRQRSKSSQKSFKVPPTAAVLKSPPETSISSPVHEHASPHQENRLASEMGDELYNQICDYVQKKREQVGKLPTMKPAIAASERSPKVQRRQLERSFRMNRNVFVPSN